MRAATSGRATTRTQNSASAAVNTPPSMTKQHTAAESGTVRLNKLRGEWVMWEDDGSLGDIDGVVDRMQVSPRVHTDTLIDLEAAR